MKPEWGVDSVAKILDITPFLCRQKLRKAGVDKSGRVYDFKNEKGAEKVAKQLKALKDDKKKKKNNSDED